MRLNYNGVMVKTIPEYYARAGVGGGGCMISLHSLSHNKKHTQVWTSSQNCSSGDGSSIIYFLVVPQRMLAEQNQGGRLSFV